MYSRYKEMKQKIASFHGSLQKALTGMLFCLYTQEILKRGFGFSL